MSGNLRYNLTVREGDTEQELKFTTLKEAYEAIAVIATEASTKEEITFRTFSIHDRGR